MDSSQLAQLSQKLKISPTEILREEKEILILEHLSQSSLGSKLIFKGGTALRLCYGSPRFSQDLDFNQKESITSKELRHVLETLINQTEDLQLIEVVKKRFTLFALLKVNSDLLAQPYSIKIEISTKQYRLKKNDYQLKICRSPTSPLTPLLFVYSLERILKEKLIAIKTRAEPRDFFDLWFVSQKLGRPIKLPKPKIHPSQFKGEIAQLLPNNWKGWPKNFLEGKV